MREVGEQDTHVISKSAQGGGDGGNGDDDGGKYSMPPNPLQDNNTTAKLELPAKASLHEKKRRLHFIILRPSSLSRPVCLYFDMPCRPSPADYDSRFSLLRFSGCLPH